MTLGQGHAIFLRLSCSKGQVCPTNVRIGSFRNTVSLDNILRQDKQTYYWKFSSLYRWYCVQHNIFYQATSVMHVLMIMMMVTWRGENIFIKLFTLARNVSTGRSRASRRMQPLPRRGSRNFRQDWDGVRTSEKIKTTFGSPLMHLKSTQDSSSAKSQGGRCPDSSASPPLLNPRMSSHADYRMLKGVT